MSTLPTSIEVHPVVYGRETAIPPIQAAGLAALLAVLGLSTIWPVALALWDMWTNDALKSIGMFIPLISFVLVLRAWKSLDWEMEGSWWGLVVLAVTAFIVHLRSESIFLLVLSSKSVISMPPPALIAFAYGAGVTLFFGGPRLFRAALFPLLLLWFVNPVPHAFNVFVDLPLQRISAHIARTFAISLGQPLSPDQLRLMFTPKFGMFIAPGCNGIRGAVTMGFIALISGYVYRFRRYAHAAVVAGAVLLGYVFNFARLCLLVLYYLVALHFPWLQNKAKLGDYIIGGTLFFCATFILFYVIGRLRTSSVRDVPFAAKPLASVPVRWSGIYPRLAVMFVFAAFGAYGVTRAYGASEAAFSQAKADKNSFGVFPERIGSYRLERRWNENLYAGPLIFHWAQYASEEGGPRIAIGVSPVLGSHDTLICHSARGEDPLWQGQLDLPAGNVSSMGFSGAFYNNGSSQYLEATTICNGDSCGEYTNSRTHFGLVYSKPTAQAVLWQDPHRPIPILIKAETADTTLPADEARQQMTTAVRGFLSSADLSSLTRPYRNQ